MGVGGEVELRVQDGRSLLYSKVNNKDQSVHEQTIKILKLVKLS